MYNLFPKRVKVSSELKVGVGLHLVLALGEALEMLLADRVLVGTLLHAL